MTKPWHKEIIELGATPEQVSQFSDNWEVGLAQFGALEILKSNGPCTQEIVDQASRFSSKWQVDALKAKPNLQVEGALKISTFFQVEAIKCRDDLTVDQYLQIGEYQVSALCHGVPFDQALEFIRLSQVEALKYDVPVELALRFYDMCQVDLLFSASPEEALQYHCDDSGYPVRYDHYHVDAQIIVVVNNNTNSVELY